MHNFLVWLIAGAVLGGLASLAMRNQASLSFNIGLGVVGAFIAGVVFTPLTAYQQDSVNRPALLVALAGAASLLAVVNFLHQGELSTR